MPFFQPPLRLDEFQRAGTAYPVASTSTLPRDDSPSPNKKRRVGSLPPALAAQQRAPASSTSRGTSQSPAPRSRAAARKSLSDAARRNEINSRYAELTRDEARLQATLRLQDAWEDIQRRHSKLAQTGSGDAASGTTTKRRYRHRPGRTRALPVEEDDIIDLSCLDFVQDRGVLRSSKARGFAIGSYGNSRDGEVLVGLDTGGDGAGGADEGENGTADEDEDEDEEEEWQDYTDSDAPTYSSDDELDDDDDLLPPPSLLFREQRRKEAERLREMREFQEQEAHARGELARAQQDDVIVVGGGNVQLPAPIGPPSSAPRGRRLVSLASRPVSDDEDDDLALSPCRAQSMAPLQRTPTRRGKAFSQPPSSTATLRRSVSALHFDSPQAHRTSRPSPIPQRATTVKPSPRPRQSPAPIKEVGIRPPPSSFSSTRLPPSRRDSFSRPPVSSSPLREVISVASPTPPPAPPARRPRQPRQRSPSPELYCPVPPRSATVKPVQKPTTVPVQQATPTPTPPPAPKISVPVQSSTTSTTKPRARRRHHSFELIIDVKPQRSRLTPAPPSRSRPAPVAAKQVASSASMPNLPTVPKVGGYLPELDEDLAQATRRVNGLSTPPLSKRSTAPALTRRSLSASPPKARGEPPPPPSISRSRVTATPSVILPAPPKLPPMRSARRVASEDDSEEDELMLSSPTKPSPYRRGPSVRPSMTPAPPRRSSAWPRSRSRSVSVARNDRPPDSGVAWKRKGPVAYSAVEDSESEDELGQCDIANVASSAVDLTPQHAAWLLELVVSVSTTCHCLAIVSYLLSPGHLLVLVYRLVLQIQFTLPRRVHAARSFRFFVLLWGVQAIAAVIVHGATGSQGTKGPKGYVQRGLVLDFVGQAYTPSTAQLVALDVLLAVLQLATLVLAFGATVPSDLDATTDAEGSRDYSSLLGIDQDDFANGRYAEEQDDIIFDGGDWRGSSSRTSAGYEAVDPRAEDPSDPYGDPNRGQGPSSKYYSASGPSAQRLTIPIPLIASLRLRTVWREVRKSARATAAEREEGGLRGMEEGRGPS